MKIIKNIGKKIVYSNLHICALSGYFWRSERNALVPYAKKVSDVTGWNMVHSISKIMWASFMTGCNFEEYYSLKFYDRTYVNQQTILTRYFNHIVVYRFNNYESNIILNDKSIFNKQFSAFRNIRWVDLGESEDIILSFFQDESIGDVIIKPKSGHSGSGVMLDNAKRILEEENLSQWLMTHSNSICEERLHNCSKLDELNSSSLNTIRAITFNGTIVWAGIRVGRPGQIVDNISQGGCICSIDEKTGCINSEAHDKAGQVVSVLGEGKTTIGFQIPNWHYLKSFICEVSNSFPEMKFVAWDFAITEKGPVLIEGNNGVDNRISQVHLKVNECGLRPKLQSIINETI